jgi:hypothetical protein
MKSRTPSDSAIVAIFRDKRKPQNAAQAHFRLISWESFNDMAARRAFCKAVCAASNLRRTSEATKLCPYLCARRGFMHQMKPAIKPAALVDRF